MDRNHDELELQREVEKICDEFGLLWHHDIDSRLSRGTRGFPDLVIAGPRGLIIPELKSNDGITSADQDRWGWTLSRAWTSMGLAGHPSGWILWTPAELADRTIRSCLEAIA